MTVDPAYRNRDKMTLEELILDVEEVNFRTPYDTGANANAMMVWNIIREWAGMGRITMDDLILKYYVDELGMTPEKGRLAHEAHEKWYREYRKQRDCK